MFYVIERTRGTRIYFQTDRALSDTSLKDFKWIFVSGNFCSEKRIVFPDWDGEEILF